MIRLLAILLVSSLALRAEPVSKVFSFAPAEKSEVEEALKQVLSPKAKTVFLMPERKVLVQDEPEYVETAEAVIKQLAAPRPNIKVEVIFNEDSPGTEQNANVRWRVGGNDVQVGNGHGPKNSLDVDLTNRSTSTSSSSSQFLVVQSGRSASIKVVQEVPFVDYFFAYAVDHGYVTQEMHWREIGSQLSVCPRVSGDVIEVELMPQITTLVDAREQVIDYRDLATVVTVGNGQEVSIGGFNGATDEFNRNFFSGGGRSGRSQNTGFKIRASVLEAFPSAQ